MNQKTYKVLISSLFFLCIALTSKNILAQSPALNNGAIPATARPLSPNEVSPEIKNLLKYYDKQIYFTENKGQWENNVLYKAEFPLGSATVTGKGVEMNNYNPADIKARYDWGIAQEKAQHDHQAFNKPQVRVRTGDWLMKFANSSPNMTISGHERHSDVFNYFHGNVAATNVNNYQEVWYSNVYKNVDVRYYPSAEGSLEYDIVCKPGFDKKLIAIQLEGINKMHLTKNGGLVLTTAVGDMSFPAPIAYQKIDGKQVPVKAKYHIDANNNIAFDLGSYNSSLPLIIDPIALRWATWVNLNSTKDDHGHGIWVDNDGSIYVVSRVNGTASLEVGGLLDTANGGLEMVVGKYTEPATVGGSGSRVWQTYVGGKGDDNPYALEEGPDGNIYIVGYTASSDFPLSAGSAFAGASIDQRAQTTQNIFITKITPSGTSIKSAVIGGDGTDNAYDLRIDPTTNNIVVCGSTSSDNLASLFPLLTGITASNGTDALVFKINSDLSQVFWLKNYGGSGSDIANIMLQNPVTGDIFVGGSTTSTDFPTSSNARQKTFSGSGNQDGFIQKLSSSGTVRWTSYFNSAAPTGSGKSKVNYSSSILCMEFNLPNYNKLYFGGITTSLIASNISGAYRSTYNGGDHDFFVSLMDTAQTLSASTYIGGTGDEINLMGLNVDQNTNVYIFGYSNSTSTLNSKSNPPVTATNNFYTSADALQKENRGDYDKVFCKLPSNLGSAPIYSTFYGGANSDYDPVGERGIKFADCRIYTIVTSQSLNIPLTQGAINTHRNASDDQYEPGLVVWANPPDFLTNTITGKQTIICAGTKPDSIKGSLVSYSLPQISRNDTISTYPTGGFPSPTYQWQYSTDSVNWTLIAGATNQNLPGGTNGLIPVLTKKTYFERIISGDACVIAGAANQIVTIQTVGVSGVVTNVSCNGFSNGSITVTGVGTSPFHFKWFNGSTSATVSGLAAGTYSITTTDGTSCTGVNSFVVTQPSFALTVSPNTTSPATCGSANGSGSVSASGGTIPYTYTWNPSEPNGPSLTGLSGGTYNVTVTDKNSCTASTSIIVGQPETITSTITPTNPLCAGGSTGSIALVPSNGITPYTFKWSNGASTQNLSNIPSTSYSVTITDKNGCNQVNSTLLTDPAVLSATPSSTPANCNGGNDGTASANASGGTTNYTYLWSNGKTTGTITGLSATTYFVTVTDAHGCTAPGQTTVGQPSQPLSVIPTSTPVSCNGYFNGTASAGASGGTTNYTYIWSNGKTDATITGLSSATYFVTVTDAHGCVLTGQTTVGTPTGLAATPSSTPASCNGFFDGTATANASGGTTNYTYLWSNGKTAGTITGLSSTTYFVTVTDAHGCSTTGQTTVGQPANPLSALPSSTPASCNGFADGTANANATGGTPGYTYIWSNGKTDGNITGLSSTTYFVTVIDAHGCTTTGQTTVGTPTAVAATPSSTPVSCNGFADGTANANATGGTPGYTYIWSNGKTDGNITGLSSTTYFVTVTDAHGCTTTGQTTVGTPTAVAATPSSTPVSCNGYADGTANANATGGTPGYTYIWSNGKTDGNITGLSADTYFVTVTDSHGCTTTGQTTVGTPTAVAATPSSTPVSCNGYADGTANANATGGTPGYTYIWSNGKTDGNITGLSSDTYFVTVTDSHGCTTTGQTTVGTPTAVAATPSSTPVSCNGYSDGTANANATGGTPGYTYIWSNGKTDGNITGLSADTYFVTVTDAHGCTTTGQTTVGTPTAVAATPSSTPVSCNGFADGTANANATGGTPGYTYIWSNGKTDGNITGLSSTTYFVTVTDAHGCTITGQTTVGTPTAVAATPSSTPVSCNGYADGTANANATGGTPGYTYIWSNGKTDGNITGLSADTYFVTVTDSHGCTTTGQTTVGTPTAVAATPSSTPASCNGFADGTANANPTGGTPGYTYIWSNGKTDGNITGLSSTTYFVTVTDSHGCTTTGQTTVGTPTAVAATPSSTPASCNGFADGTANANATGGTPGYTYIWSNGKTDGSITGLSSTTYFVTVTDAHGCTTTGQTTVGTPTAVAATPSSTPASCNGFADGTANANATGGTPGYTYIWSNGKTDGNITGLSSDTYFVTITDAHGCTTTGQTTVGTPTAVAATPSSTPVSCNGYADGTANANATGGTPGYTYIWSNGKTDGNITGLSSDTYFVTVTDSHGCTTTGQTTVGTPTAVAATPSSTPVSCNGFADGTANANATGGTPGYTYIWSNGKTDGNITGLSADTYFVTVTDSHGCTTTGQTTVGTPTAVAATPSSTPVSCNGYSDGTANANATGGTPGYTYIWSNGKTDGNITGLSSTTYFVTVTDSHGCTTTGQTTVGTPTAVAATPSSTPVSCNGYADGTANANATGGTPDYTYIWSNGKTNGNITGLSADTYFVTVTDSHGCTTTGQTTVGTPTAVAATPSSTPVSCNGYADGTANANATGGTPGYTYIWSNGKTDGNITGLSSDTYFVTVTDSHGCTTTGQTTVGTPTAVAATPSSTPASCNGFADGTANANATGGTPGYTYIWSNGKTDGNITGLSSTTYFVTVTDAHGCTITGQTTVGTPTGLSLTPSSTDISCNSGSNGIATLTQGNSSPLSSDGTASVDAQGGTPSYTYNWSNGGTTSEITGLTPATYYVTVTDANGCSSITQAVVGEPPVLALTPTSTPVTCNGYSDGTANANATGGTPGYTYIWSNGKTDGNITGLTAITYNVTVTDSHGCSTANQTTVGTPTAVAATPSSTPVSCNGYSDGTANANATGGTPGYTYIWSNGKTDGNITGLSADTYFVTVTDSHGCTTTGQTTVGTPTAVAATPSSTPVSCNGYSDGTANANATGGTQGYTYIWSNGKTDGNITGLSSDTYFVTVTDSHGCTTTGQTTVGTPTAVAATPSSTPASCNGFADGTANANPTGGTPGYTYIWSNGKTDGNITGLSSTTYFVTVTDAHGCTTTGQTTVGTPTGLAATPSSTPVSCNGYSDGTANANATGGTPGYTYIWSNGKTDGNITGLSSTTYFVTVTDSHGCTTTGQTTVGTPTGLAAKPSSTPVSCNGYSNGTANANATGGTPGYTYIWSNGKTDGNITGLSADTYFVTVTDSHGCTTTGQTTVGTPTAVAATPSSTPVSCNGYADGTANANATGGTPNYTYIWSNGKTDGNITGLSSTTYFVTITDSHGCTTTGQTTVGTPTAVAATPSSTPVSCNGYSNGTANANATGGTPGYTYIWSNGKTDGNITGLSADTYFVTVTDAHGCTTTGQTTVGTPTAVAATPSSTPVSCNGYADGTANANATGGTPGYTYIWSNGKTDGNITGLSADTYFVTVTDSHGCTTTGQTTVGTPTAVAATPSSTPVSCNGYSNGTANANATGGTPGYTYIWSNGKTDGNITGLSADTYFVTVTDSHGCTTTGQTTVGTPTAVAATPSSTPVSCNGYSDGTANANATGGTPGYTYIWSNGKTDGNITGLSADTYFVTVTDSHGCTTTGQTTVGTPTAVAATPSSTPASCNGFADGTANANATGGTPGYTYIWSNGKTDGNITGLSSTTYFVTVTDSHGCTTTGQTTVGTPTGLAAKPSSTPVSCNGYSNGTANANATGGTPGYTYIWSNGKTDGNITGLSSTTYFVTVTDAHGCTTTGQTTVGTPTALAATPSSTPANCNGGNDGTASANATGGTLSYTYNWSNGKTTSTITGLTAITYYVTVTDAHGCSATGQTTVGQPTAITPTISHVNTNSCQGGNCNGSINLLVNGGVSPYTFKWSNGSTNESISNLCQARYYVTVTDSHGCVALANDTVDCCATSITITKKLSPLTALPPASDWQFTSNIPGYSNFTIPAAGGSAVLTGMPFGTYTVTEIPSKNWVPSNTCAVDSNTASITVNTCGNLTCAFTNTQRQTPPCNTPFSVTLDSTDVSCHGSANGSVKLIVNGGISPYTFHWSNNATTQNISGLCGGTYCVTVTYSHGCSASASGCVKVNEPNTLTACVIGKNVTCNGGNDGTATLTVNGGTMPYTYVWSNKATTQNLTGLMAGIYCVTVTDAHHCMATASVCISQNPVLTLCPVSTNSTTSSNCSTGCNGSVGVNVTGGVSPYKYKWTTGNTTSSVSNLCGGTYTVTVTDYAGCVKIASVNVNCIPACNISLTTSYTHCTGSSNCSSGCNGTASVTAVNNAVSPYTYKWSTGAATSSISNLCGGTYTVTVTDHVGCSKTASFTLNCIPACNISLTTGYTHCTGSSNCSSGCNGTASVTAVNNAVSPYTYKWSTGAATSSISNLCGGTYTVTVTDHVGCSKTASFTLNCIPACNISLTTSYTHCTGSSNCSSGCNGTASVTAVNNAVSPYTYKWSTGAATSSISNLCGGTYTVTVTDHVGCVKTASFTLNCIPACNISLTTSYTHCTGSSNCSSGCNGTASVTAVNNAVSPYTYKWSTGAANASISNLCGGTYTVTVTDHVGCVKTASFTLNCIPACNISLTTSYTHCTGSSNCSSGCNGTASVTAVNNAVSPYTYKWSTGAATASISNLCGGTYTVTVTDHVGCVKTASFTLNCIPACNISLSTTSANCTSSTNCSTGCNGTASVTAVNNAVSPYTYKWSTGAATSSISALCGGTYTVTVTDHVGCSKSASFTIVCTRSTTPQCNISLATNYTHCTSSNNCSTGCNGTASVIVSNAVAPYRYKWSTGAVTSCISNLCGGTYTVTVTDYVGCSKTASVTISCISVCNLSVSGTVTKNNCNGGNAGSVTLTVSNGTAPFKYKWSNGQTTANIYNLCSGNYYVTVTDAKGCSATGTFGISQNSPICVSLSRSNCTYTLSNQICNGAISASAYGGQAPYTYLWSNRCTTAGIKGLCNGTYTVTVTDAYGCHQTACITITCTCSWARMDESTAATTDTLGQSLVMNAFPNPFMDEATVEFVSPENTNGTLEIYNMTGQMVDILYKGSVDAGVKYTFLLHGSDLPAGLYICRLVTDNGVFTKNMVKMK